MITTIYVILLILFVAMTLSKIATGKFYPGISTTMGILAIVSMVILFVVDFVINFILFILHSRLYLNLSSKAGFKIAAYTRLYIRKIKHLES